MVCTNATLPASAIASSIVLRAHILDAAGRPVCATDVVGIECTVRSVGSYMPGAGIDTNPFEVILPSLVRDQFWAVDDIGYNFRHDLTDVADLASLALPEFGGRGSEIRLYASGLHAGNRELLFEAFLDEEARLCFLCEVQSTKYWVLAINI